MKTSIFVSCYNDLITIEDRDLLCLKIKEVVDNSKIDSYSKRKILFDVEQSKNSLFALQNYLTNSMLKFSGLGVTKTK